MLYNSEETEHRAAIEAARLMRADNRIMFSFGKAAEETDYMDGDIIVQVYRAVSPGKMYSLTENPNQQKWSYVS